MVYTLLIKQFLRSRVAIIGLGLLFIAGLTAILIGKSFLAKQQRHIAATEAFQQQHIQRNVEYMNDDMGLLLYYLRFGYVNKLQPLNGLSIGQRDVNMGIQQVTIRTLEEKKYDTDLNNPVSLLFGNLDFGFVLIYLFPLVIIAFCYNILSEEKEGGTWKLLNVQGRSARKLLFQKMIVRFSFVMLNLLLLNIISVLVLGISLNAAYFATLLAGILYLVFWFALCGWIISFQKNSSSSAALLLTAWLLLTIMAPAVINNYIIARYPVPEALHTAVANREGYHGKWDRPKEETMQRFYEHYPQFASYKLPEKEFSWLWYYAMQQMGDDDAAKHSQEMRGKLLKRDRISHNIGYFIPSLHTQLQLNELTRAGLKNQVSFLDSLTSFHERKRLYFYPKIFENVPVLNENWTMHPVEFFEEKVCIDWLRMITPYVVITGMLLLFTTINFKRKYEM